MGLASSERDFDVLVRENSSAVRRYAFYLVKDSWFAEDVMQETFLRAWKYWPTFRGESTAQAWLIRICRNVAFDFIASRKDTRLERPQQIIAPDNRIVSAESIEALLRVPLVNREVVFLVDVCDYDYASVARILDCPIGTVRSRLARGRKQLAKFFDRSLVVAQSA